MICGNYILAILGKRKYINKLILPAYFYFLASYITLGLHSTRVSRVESTEIVLTWGKKGKSSQDTRIMTLVVYRICMLVYVHIYIGGVHTVYVNYYIPIIVLSTPYAKFYLTSMT